MAVVTMAIRDLATGQIPGDVPTLGVALISFVGATLFGAGATAVSGWQPMSNGTLALLSIASLFVLAGYVFIIIATRVGEIAVVAPFRYSIVLWALCLGYFVWGDVPDMLTLTGTAIVVAMGVFTFFREQHGMRSVKT